MGQSAPRDTLGDLRQSRGLGVRFRHSRAGPLGDRALAWRCEHRDGCQQEAPGAIGGFPASASCTFDVRRTGCRAARAARRGVSAIRLSYWLVPVGASGSAILERKLAKRWQTFSRCKSAIVHCRWVAMRPFKYSTLTEK